MAFDFLKLEWGIELKPEGRKEIEDYAEGTSKKHIVDYIKDSDIRKLGVIPSLPKDLARSAPPTIPLGQYLVQVVKIADITQPARFQEDFEGGKWRLLRIDLSDGEQKIPALEYGPTKELGVHLPPGTKLLLWSTANAPLKMQNGHMLLTGDNVQVIGGNVEKLVESWRASKEVESNRLLWRTEGIRKTDKADAAPPWTDFDPKKAPRHGGGDKQMENERAEWRRAGSSGGPALPAHAGSTREDDGSTRFEVDKFNKSDVQVKSQVASSAFASVEPRKGKGKGKGKEEGGKRGRKGRDWDDDGGGEEKRAPVAGASLAAFIKPTKDGGSGQEALAAFPDAKPQAQDWAEESWADDGWGAGAWGQSQGWGGGGGGGGGAWKASGGGWSSGGGGGGGRGKGGGRKGGGGKRGGGGGGGW